MSLTNRHADGLSERQEMEVLKIGMQSSQGGDKKTLGSCFLPVCPDFLSDYICKGLESRPLKHAFSADIVRIFYGDNQT